MSAHLAGQGKVSLPTIGAISGVDLKEDVSDSRNLGFILAENPANIQGLGGLLNEQCTVYVNWMDMRGEQFIVYVMEWNHIRVTCPVH